MPGGRTDGPVAKRPEDGLTGRWLVADGRTVGFRFPSSAASFTADSQVNITYSINSKGRGKIEVNKDRKKGG